MPLPTGTWKAIVSGAETDFSVEAPNPQGLFVGTLFGTNLSGFWDESSQKMSFTFLPVIMRCPEIGVFEGYLFRTPPNPAIGQDVVARLAGTVSSDDCSAHLKPAGRDRSKKHVCLVGSDH